MSDADANSKKKLSDLKVKDLRQQLEKRSLDRTGNKTVLVERLTKALQSEGHNPEEYFFDVVSEVKTPVKSPVKRPSRKNRDNGIDIVQDEGDADDDDDEEKQISVIISSKGEQENKKELNKDQDGQGEKQDVNKLGNPGSQKVLQYNEGKDDDNNLKESTSGVAGQLSPQKSQLTPIITSGLVKDSAISDKCSSKNPSDNISLNTNRSNTEDMNVSVDKPNDGLQYKHISDEVKSTSCNVEKQADVAPNMSNDSLKSEVSDSLAKHEVEKTKGIVDTDVKDASPKRTGRESTETSTAATDEKSVRIVERSSKDTVFRKVEGTEGLKNLWICGLTSKTRAADLKALFIPYGKVASAKIVTSAKAPTSRFGFVVMATSESASLCVQHVNNTEFQDEIITVEKTTRELQPNGTIKHTPEGGGTQVKCVQPITEETQKQPEDTAEGEAVKKEDGEEQEKKKEKENANEKEAAKVEVKEDKRKSDGVDDRKSRKVSSRDRFSRARDESRGWRESRARTYGRLPQRGRFYRSSGYAQRSFSRNYNDYRERGVRRLYPSHSRFSSAISNEELRLEREKELLRLEKEKIEIERLKLEKEKHRFEREQLELEKAELRARKLSQAVADHRPLKRPFDVHRGKDEGRHWSDRKRVEGSHDTMGRGRSPNTHRFGEYSRERFEYHDKRSESYGSRPKGDIRPHLSGSSRHEGRHETEGRIFVRGRHEEPDEKRPREDWKSSKGRSHFERSSSRGFPTRHGIESPNPWNSPTERELKFDSASVTPSGQWGPIKSDNWGRMDGPSAKRWAGIETRGQPPMGHPGNQQGMFSGSSNAMASNMPGNFPLDQFNISNVIGRF